MKLITTDEAKEMCNKVFVESQFYAKCKEFLKEDFNNLEADCMEDVEVGLNILLNVFPLNYLISDKIKIKFYLFFWVITDLLQLILNDILFC